MQFCKLSFRTILAPIVASLLLASPALAKTIVTGHISTATTDEVTILMVEKNLNNTSREFKVAVQNGVFRLDNLPLHEARFVTLAYKGKRFDFFLTPNDSLHLEIDAASFPEGVAFGGRGAINNTAWQRFEEIFGEDSYSTMYKTVSKGAYSYTLENSLANKINTLSAQQFTNELDVTRQNKTLTIDALEKELGAFSTSFKAYMWAEINYDWAYKYLAYGYLQGKNSKLPFNYYEALQETPLQNAKAMGNVQYQNYVLAYLNYTYHQKKSEGSAFVGIYNAIDDQLNFKTAELFKGVMIAQAIRLKDTNTANGLYTDYISKYNGGDYATLVTDLWERFTQTMPTTIAGKEQARNKTYDEKVAAVKVSNPVAMPTIALTPPPALFTTILPTKTPLAPVVANNELRTIQRSRSVITGFLQNAAPNEIVKVQIFMESLNNASIEYVAHLQSGAFFRIDSIEIEEPRLVILQCSQQKIELFLERNDSLHIELDALQFATNPKFSGRAARNNECFYAYRRNNIETADLFSLTTFRKGTYTYLALNELDERMRAFSRTDFEAYMNQMRKDKQDIIAQYEAQKGSITEGLHQFMWAEINYDWAYKMLIYGYAYGNKHDLPNDYWHFLDEVPVQNDHALGSEKYQRFVMAYTNYWYMKKNKEGSPYRGEYTESSELISGKVLQYFRAALLIDAIKNNTLEVVVDDYKEFLYQNHNPYYAQILSDLYQGVTRYSAGSPAPSFELADATGKTISLNDFKGKVVYLDFWATWCGACMRKMALMEQTERVIMQENPNVVFVHISLDKNVAAWQDAVQHSGYPGIHLISSEGPVGTIAKRYNINALPEFYLISKSGEFAEKPASHDNEELKAMLFDLSKKIN